MIPDLSRISCLGELLRDALLTYKSNVALVELDRHREQRRLTYAELLGEAETVTATLQSSLSAGERCAILMSNQSRWVSAALGAMFAGAVLVPLDYKLTAREQLALLRHAKPALLFVDYPLYRDLWSAGLEQLEAPIRVIVVEAPARAELAAGHERFPDPDPVRAADSVFRPRARQDLACIVYSSGTGGAPKGCMLTHDSYLVQAESLARLVPMRESDCYFSVLPTNHAIDFMCGVIVPYLHGASVVHQRTLRAEFVVSTMKQCRITHTALVPRILKSLRDGIEEELDKQPEWRQTLVRGLMEANDVATMKSPNHRLSRYLLYPIQQRFGGRLRMIIAGGSFVDPELANYFYRLGFPVVIGYGLTESCVALTLNDLRPFRANSVGKPVPGVTIEIRDPDAEGVGEVYARGRSIMSGYLDAPELTEEALQQGFLRTGDLGRFDASGHLQLRGRAKNMIVTDGGKNVYPEDVEAALDGMACEELCVLSESFVWPDTSFSGARLLAVVRPRDGQTVQAIHGLLVERNRALAEYRRLGAFVLCTEPFPVTASMKVKRQELAQLLRGRGMKRIRLTEPLDGE